MITTEVAAQLFMDRIMTCVYHRTHKGFDPDLIEGLTGLADDLSEIEIWYGQLDDISKKNIMEIVQAVIKRTIFSFLVVLDNRTGGYPITGQESDFAIYLQVYKDPRSLVINQPEEIVRFNSINDQELHDLFTFRLNEQ